MNFSDASIPLPCHPERSEGSAVACRTRRKQIPHCVRDDKNRPRARGTQSGYTLIEVIVAFALLALALTLLLGTLSGATRQVRWAGDAGRAALHAQSLLDQQGISEPIQPGERTGEFDDGRYRWTLGVTPWTDPALPPANPQPIASAQRLYRLHLAVEWGDGGPRQRLDMQTLRLVQSTGVDAVAFP